MDMVIYHANCPDGFGAAYAASKKLASDTLYVPASYSDSPPNVENVENLYIVDFSYSKEILLDLAKKVNNIQVIDHHKTAKEDLKDLDFALFDMNKSGAVLTWEYFNPDVIVPELLLYVQDRDLWQWKLPNSKEVSAGISLESFDFKVWDSFTIENLIETGKTVLKYKTQLINQICKNVIIDELDGNRIPIVNSCMFQSEIGNELCKLYPNLPFAAIYYKSDKEIWSLRSNNGFDVSVIAKKFGGGGHAAAAGFTK